MSDEHIEQIGKLADRLNLYRCATKLSLPPETHVKCLTDAIEDVEKALKAIYIKATGGNPWEGEPEL